ncbi:MAG: hypothetical protein RLZZ234_65 [Candidatus Parcubacteria bacterium]|jgi:hypothetical protein
MIITALFFDIFQFFPKILIAVSLAAVGLVAWVPIFGQVLAVVAIGLAIAVDLALSGLIMGTGYMTNWLWFQQHGVRIMEGKFIGRKTIGFFATMLLELMPFMNALPGITLWTTTTILYSWKEDTIRHAKILHKERLHAAQLLRQRHEQAQAYEAQRTYIETARMRSLEEAPSAPQGGSEAERHTHLRHIAPAAL